MTAANVAYQSGLVAVEGGAEFDVQVKPDDHARRADVGQLAPAEYQPGLRLLGAYSYVYDKPNEPKIAIDVVRNPSYALTPAIIERAALKTLLSADGNSQTQANFQLRTKALYLEVALPKDATLWSAVLDGVRLKPQKQGGVRLLGLPPGAAGAPRSLQIAYDAPVADVLRGGRLRLVAPRLLYRAGNDAKKSTEIPLINVQWNVTVPAGYEVESADGTLEAIRITRPTPAPLVVADVLYRLSGGRMAEEMDMVSNLSSSRKSPTNAMQQSGIAMHSKADDVRERADEYVSNDAEYKAPDGAKDGRDREAMQRVVTQDNMIRELGKKRADTNGEPAVPVMAPPPPAARPNAADIHSNLGYAYDPSSVNSTAKTPPAADMPAPAAPPAVVTATAPAAAEAKPEPAKPEEPLAARKLVGGWGVDVSDAKSGKPVYRGGKLLGVSSLKIDIQQAAGDEQVLTFTSLGADPEVVISLADRNHVQRAQLGRRSDCFPLRHGNHPPLSPPEDRLRADSRSGLGAAAAGVGCRERGRDLQRCLLRRHAARAVLPRHRFRPLDR